MPTAPTPVTAPPTTPDRSDRSTFPTRVYDFWVWEAGALISGLLALATNAYNNAVETFTNAQTSTTNAATASAAAATATSTANAVAWVNGNTYALNAASISQLDFQTYRKITASSVTTIDPSLDATNWVIVGGDKAWVIKTGNYTALAADRLMVNTASAAITITLPASPSASQSVSIADYAGTFATNNLTVARNGNKIMGLSEDMTVSTNNVSFTLTYIDATQGWRIS